VFIIFIVFIILILETLISEIASNNPAILKQFVSEKHKYEYRVVFTV